ncbi:MAG: DUF5050 domain-containing protein, partial [Bacillota bacterium]|nr:DUF5050 domain-containing protein [Bacillota bacterium]
MASCINCGRELGSSESFCENCGYPVPGSSSNTYNDTIIRKEILTESSSPPKLMMEHLKPVSNFKLKNLLFLLPVVIISAALLIYFNNRPEKADNSLDNLQNGGYAAIQGNWIYYSANGGLYKMNSRSGSSTKITDGYYKSIGAMDDWIYFLGDSGDGILNFNKIKSDGSEKTGTDSIPIFTAADEEYFCKIFDGYFYKTSKDGTEIRLPLDTAESLLAVDGEKIYTLKPEYNTSDSSRGNVKIYQSDKDFKNKKLVFDKDLSSLGGNIHIQNNQIYFIDTVNSSNYTSLSAYNITT